MDNNSENNVADKKEAEYIIVYDESDNNSDSNLEEMNNLQDVNNSLLVNRRKLNQRVGTAGRDCNGRQLCKCRVHYFRCRNKDGSCIKIKRNTADASYFNGGYCIYRRWYWNYECSFCIS